MYLLTMVLGPGAGGHGRRAPPADGVLAQLRSLAFVTRVRGHSRGPDLHIALFVSARSRSEAEEHGRTASLAVCPDNPGAWHLKPGSLTIT